MRAWRHGRASRRRTSLTRCSLANGIIIIIIFVLFWFLFLLDLVVLAISQWCQLTRRLVLCSSCSCSSFLMRHHFFLHLGWPYRKIRLSKSALWCASAGTSKLGWGLRALLSLLSSRKFTRAPLISLCGIILLSGFRGCYRGIYYKYYASAMGVTMNILFGIDRTDRSSKSGSILLVTKAITIRVAKNTTKKTWPDEDTSLIARAMCVRRHRFDAIKFSVLSVLSYAHTSMSGHGKAGKLIFFWCIWKVAWTFSWMTTKSHFRRQEEATHGPQEGRTNPDWCNNIFLSLYPLLLLNIFN